MMTVVRARHFDQKKRALTVLMTPWARRKRADELQRIESTHF
jgi:hypothetical protein